METEITKTELIATIISEIDFLENEQLLRLYREVYGDIHEDQVDWEDSVEEDFHPDTQDNNRYNNADVDVDMLHDMYNQII